MTNTESQSVDTGDLDIRLKKLQSDAQGHFEAYRRTNVQLHNLLVGIYLWWRDASDKPEYIESIYRLCEQRGIRHKTTGNQPNFSPLIRLVFGIERPSLKDRGTISQWNQALQSLHQQYCEHTDEFRHNAPGKLFNFFETEDGGGSIGVWKFARGGRTKKEPLIDDTDDTDDANDTDDTDDTDDHSLPKVAPDWACGTE